MVSNQINVQIPMTNLATELNAIREEAVALEVAENAFFKRINKLVGMRVKILCPRYNGQPYGRSRKPLTGRVLEVCWALRWGKSVGVGFRDYSEGIDIEKVMFIQENPSRG